MIELNRHIENLLLENDCVIIPNLGGFIAHYQPARYIAEENLYLPPIRTIGFNPQLKLNDGMLAHSYMQVYHTDYRDALRMIEKAVEELKETLYREGYAEMHGIGALHYTMRGTYEFHPNEDGALSPSLYGLNALSIRRLAELPNREEPKTATLHPRRKKHDSARIIRFTRQWMGNAAAVAAAIILFFFLSVPVENTYVDKGNYASLGTDGLIDAIRSQSLATTFIQPQTPQKEKNNRNTLKPVKVKVEKVAKPTEETPKQVAEAPKAAEAPKKKLEGPTVISVPKRQEPNTPTGSAVTKPQPVEKVATPTAQPTPKKGRYNIIVSSLPTAKDAEQVAKGYQKKGYADARVVEGNGRFRISLCNFADKTEAYRQLNELKKDEAFKNAWVLSIK